MLQLFRSNQLYILPLLLIAMLILRAIGFIEPVKIPFEHSGFLSDNVYDWVGLSGWVPQIMAAILIFIQAWLVNAVAQEYQLLHENTWYPALFFLILTSFSAEMQTFSPVLMGNTFLLFAIIETFRSYRNLQSADTIFNIGMWIAVASMFYSAYWVFLIWGILGITLLRNFKIEETLILIIGFFVPYFLLCVYFFWTGNLMPFFKLEVWKHFGFLSFHLEMTWQHFVTLFIWGVALVNAFFNAPSFYDKTSIQAQRCIQLLFWALGLVTLSLFTQAEIDINHLFLLAIPLSIFTASTFLQVKKTMYSEFAFIVVVLMTLVFQYQAPLLAVLAK